VAEGARREPRWSAVITIFGLVFFAIVFLLPFAWMVGTSLQPEEEGLSQDKSFFENIVPRRPDFSNYTRALKTLRFWPCLLNTLYVCIFTVIGTLVSCSVVAYGFSRLRWPGRDVLFGVLLATIMLPPAALLLPQFVLFKSLGWVGSYKPLIVPAFFGNAFFIFLLRQFFLGIPQELSDAARIEGASEARILWSIIVPLSKPALATVTLFAFTWAWTDFAGPLVYLTDDRMYTLPVGLASFLDRHRADWSGLMAGTTVVTLPLAIAFLCTQRFFVRGIQLSGLKG
jgi:multiple sugar transport system permease protein